MSSADLIPDGVHFGLAEDPYHADPALGSTDTKALATDPAAWWWGSSLNPQRPEPEEDKAHRIIGRAAHKFVLEGPAAFHELYERAPEGDDLLVTSDQLGAWLRERGAKVPAAKAARLAAIREHCAAEGDAEPRVLEWIEAAAFMAGRALLKPADFDRIVQAGEAVLNNPHLSDSFTGGMPEVSVFWTDEVLGEPVRRKARFDFLKVRAVVDLKSTRPRQDMPFDASCVRALAEFGYPTQAAGYLEGRAWLRAHVAQGAVFGEHDPAWLARVAAADSFAWVFVFWASVGAPLTWGTILSPGNPILDVGAEYVRRGLEAFVAARREHGLERPWFAPAPLAELSIDAMPRWWGMR